MRHERFFHFSDDPYYAKWSLLMGSSSTPQRLLCRRDYAVAKGLVHFGGYMCTDLNKEERMYTYVYLNLFDVPFNDLDNFFIMVCTAKPISNEKCIEDIDVNFEPQFTSGQERVIPNVNINTNTLMLAQDYLSGLDKFVPSIEWQLDLNVAQFNTGVELQKRRRIANEQINLEPGTVIYSQPERNFTINNNNNNSNTSNNTNIYGDDNNDIDIEMTQVYTEPPSTSQGSRNRLEQQQQQQQQQQPIVVQQSFVPQPQPIQIEEDDISMEDDTMIQPLPPENLQTNLNVPMLVYNDIDLAKLSDFYQIIVDNTDMDYNPFEEKPSYRVYVSADQRSFAVSERNVCPVESSYQEFDPKIQQVLINNTGILKAPAIIPDKGKEKAEEQLGDESANTLFVEKSQTLGEQIERLVNTNTIADFLNELTASKNNSLVLLYGLFMYLKSPNPNYSEFMERNAAACYFNNALNILSDYYIRLYQYRKRINNQPRITKFCINLHHFANITLTNSEIQTQDQIISTNEKIFKNMIANIGQIPPYYTIQNNKLPAIRYFCTSLVALDDLVQYIANPGSNGKTVYYFSTRLRRILNKSQNEVGVSKFKDIMYNIFKPEVQYLGLAM